MPVNDKSKLPNRTVERDEDDDEEEYKELQRQPRRNLPTELVEIMVPALKVGAFSGVTGTFLGAFIGVARSSTPKLFALASGIQWFALGTSFWGFRGFLDHAWGKEKFVEKKITASALSGGFAGACGGALRGPRNIIPGTIMFALFGSAGQALYDKADARNSAKPAVDPNEKKTSWLNSKWSPVSVLSDAEYEAILREKLLGVEAQIAIVDENLKALRALERAQMEKMKDDTRQDVPTNVK